MRPEIHFLCTTIAVLSSGTALAACPGQPGIGLAAGVLESCPGVLNVATQAAASELPTADALKTVRGLAGQGFACGPPTEAAVLAQGYQCRGHVAGDYPHFVRIYIPAGFHAQNFALAYHIHGFTADPLTHPKPEWDPFSPSQSPSDGDYGRFLTQSGRNALLLIPERPGQNLANNKDLDTPAKLRGFFADADATLNHAGVASNVATPRLLSGHSGADSDLALWGQWAKSGAVDYLQSVRSVGLFYAGYNGSSQPGLLDWADALATQPGSTYFLRRNPGDSEGHLLQNNNAVRAKVQAMGNPRLNFGERANNEGVANDIFEMHYMRFFMRDFFSGSLPEAKFNAQGSAPAAL